MADECIWYVNMNNYLRNPTDVKNLLGQYNIEIIDFHEDTFSDLPLKFKVRGSKDNLQRANSIIDFYMPYIPPLLSLSLEEKPRTFKEGDNVKIFNDEPQPGTVITVDNSNDIPRYLIQCNRYTVWRSGFFILPSDVNIHSCKVAD